MFRLPGERFPIVLDDGPFAGASCDVEALAAWPLKYFVAGRFNAFDQAETPDAEFVALGELYRVFVDEAQPTWTLADHRGPIPPTVEGMWRLHLDLALGFIRGWIDPPTVDAVDEAVPPGPVRDELNRRLRAKRTTSG